MANQWSDFSWFWSRQFSPQRRCRRSRRHRQFPILLILWNLLIGALIAPVVARDPHLGANPWFRGANQAC